MVTVNKNCKSVDHRVDIVPGFVKCCQGEDTLTCGIGVGQTPIPTTFHKAWYSVYHNYLYGVDKCGD
jgi:hypothetical protein